MQSAYLDAPLEAFKQIAFDQLPGKLQTRLTSSWGDDPFESSSLLTVRNVGQVYVLDQATPNGSTIEFFDVNSDPIATATTSGSRTRPRRTATAVPRRPLRSVRLRNRRRLPVRRRKTRRIVMGR